MYEFGLLCHVTDLSNFITNDGKWNVVEQECVFCISQARMTLKGVATKRMENANEEVLLKSLPKRTSPFLWA